MSKQHLLLVSASLLAFLSPTGASAQVANPAPATGEVILLSPLSFIRVDDLLFGTVVIPTSGSGTIDIDPVTGNATYANLVPALSATVQRGLFKGGGDVDQDVTITSTLPDKLYLNGDTTLGSIDAALRFDKTETAAGEWAYKVGADHTYDVGVGGTLTVPAGVVRGQYKATIEISAEYL